ncbi:MULTISPECIES: hypothetical protein [unclassified Sphingobium]|uniref:hypothetical protein n=1 Tax=Sphingobium sp. TB-6 TaxID=2728850 RepID=UPI000AE5AB6F|nr:MULTISPECIES: hypothetical protein [Sphingomonadaceae]
MEKDAAVISAISAGIKAPFWQSVMALPEKTRLQGARWTQWAARISIMENGLAA